MQLRGKTSCNIYEVTLVFTSVVSSGGNKSVVETFVGVFLYKTI